MTPAERRIVAEFERAIATNTPARLRPSELRHLKETLPSPEPKPYDVTMGGAIGLPLTGVSIVVEVPHGYPNKVTPRARKKGHK